MKQVTRHNRIKASRVSRVRARIAGHGERPRLTVFRSNKGMYAQLIDDAKGHTLAAASSRELKAAKGAKSSVAAALGELIAKKALAAKITAAVFDRRSYRYHGRVKAFADGARKGGLKF